MVFRLLLVGWVFLCCPLYLRGAGVIEGVVINGTQDRTAQEGVDVVLRVPFDGKFVVAAQTKTLQDGSFRFEDLPLDLPGAFLPGANLSEIHFPGPRVNLDPSHPEARITVNVFESSTSPCPLVTERHAITIEAKTGLLTVRESMQINNPSHVCYVGRPRHAGGGPITLELRIPADFERITFDREGFGRQFQMINGKLVTGIPWPPGQRELRFSYAIPNQDVERVWRRTLDLPTSHLQVEVKGPDLQHLTTNLASCLSQDSQHALFDGGGVVLPVNHQLEVRLDHLPIPLMARLRWVALLTLLALSVSVGIGSLRGVRK